LNQIPHPWTLLGSDLVYPGLDYSFLELKVLIPPWTRTTFQFRLVSSIFFLSSPGKLTRVTFTQSTYPTLPDWLTRISPKHLTQTSPECLIRALPDRINAYPALYVHTRPNWLNRFFSRLDFYLPGLTRSYPAELPYPIFSRSDFCLPYRTRPPYPTSLSNRVTLRCTRLLTRPHPITLPDRVPFNWPHPKTLSSVSHVDLGLFWPIMHQDSSGNLKPTRATRITLFALPKTESALPNLTLASLNS
jgi:hypothetical protein